MSDTDKTDIVGFKLFYPPETHKSHTTTFKSFHASRTTFSAWNFTVQKKRAETRWRSPLLKWIDIITIPVRALLTAAIHLGSFIWAFEILEGFCQLLFKYWPKHTSNSDGRFKHFAFLNTLMRCTVVQGYKDMRLESSVNKSTDPLMRLLRYLTHYLTIIFQTGAAPLSVPFVLSADILTWPLRRVHHELQKIPAEAWRRGSEKINAGNLPLPLILRMR